MKKINPNTKKQKAHENAKKINNYVVSYVY